MVGKDTIRIESRDSNTDVRGVKVWVSYLIYLLSRLFL